MGSTVAVASASELVFHRLTDGRLIEPKPARIETSQRPRSSKNLFLVFVALLFTKETHGIRMLYPCVLMYKVGPYHV